MVMIQVSSEPLPQTEVSLSLSLCWWVLTSVAQQVREEVVEDFVRNFLVTVGLHKTADIFQAEW